MTDCVVDASAVVAAIRQPGSMRGPLGQRLAKLECHAPHLVDAEVGHVLRRSCRHGLLDEEVAATGLLATEYLVDVRYPHAGWLAAAAWELRGAITFYDALYVALAARLDVPLLTTDAKLSRAPGLPCQVELVTEAVA